MSLFFFFFYLIFRNICYFTDLCLKDKFKYSYDPKVLFPPAKVAEPAQSKIIITSNTNKSKLSNASAQDVVVITKLQTTPKNQAKTEEKPVVSQLPQQKAQEEKIVTTFFAQFLIFSLKITMLHRINNKKKVTNKSAEEIPRSESFMSTNNTINSTTANKTLINDSDPNLSQKENEPTTTTTTPKNKNGIKMMSNGFTNRSFESTKTNDAYYEHILTTPLLTIEYLFDFTKKYNLFQETFKKIVIFSLLVPVMNWRLMLRMARRISLST